LPSRRPEPDIREDFLIPLGPSRAEITVANSRFVASIDYVGSVGEAREFVGRIRGEFSDATHNVPAFIVGGGNSRTEFCSDDGEPSGTSGRPLLAVLRGSGLGNVAVVVTRYFGGTLLGTGGLVKAYSEAGKNVIESAQRGIMVKVNSFSLTLPYHLFEPFRTLAAECRAIVTMTDFSELVRVELEIPVTEIGAFSSRLADLSAGTVACDVLNTSMARRPLC
jgi:uncharacterized YigZ family protein